MRWLTIYQASLLKAHHESLGGDYNAARDTLLALSRNYVDNADLWHSLWFLARKVDDYDTAALAGRQYLTADPSPGYRFAKGLALQAERARDFKTFRFALKIAIRQAKRVAEEDKPFKREFKRLTRFWLEMFEPAKAQEVAARALELKLPGAEENAQALDEIIAQSEEWKPLIAEARRDVKRRLLANKETTDPEAVEVVVASAAFSHKNDDNVHFRPMLRFVYGEIYKALAASGRPIRVRTKLDSQSRITGRKKRCVISYHTADLATFSLHFKEAYQPGYFTFDSGGYAGWSTVTDIPLSKLPLKAVDKVAAKAFFESKVDEVVKKNVSKYAQPDLEDVVPSGPYIFVGLQVINDSVQRLASLPMLKMLDEVVEGARAHGQGVVVKRHPRCTSPLVRARLEAGLQGGDFVVAKGSVHNLIANATAVCVVNSGVGLEALFHRKPVYVFGKCDYWHACYQMTEAGQFAKEFRKATPALSSLDLERYIYWLHHFHFIDSNDKAHAADLIRRRVEEYVVAKRGAFAAPAAAEPPLALSA